MLLLLLVAAALRLPGVDWDGGSGGHPDERYLVGVAERLRWPGRLDPFAANPEYPYGQLPLILLALVGGRDRLMAGRLLAALLDTGTVALTGALGRRLGGRRAGTLAAAFLALMPLHVQQAHFATADPFLAFFAAGALLSAMRLAERGGWQDAALAGAAAGLAAACKATGLLLAIPLATAWMLTNRHRLAAGAALPAAALAAFLIASPSALSHLPAMARNLAGQAAVARGNPLLPYTLQYHHTLPYLYPIAQQLVWGMGPALGLLCWGGLGAAVYRALRRPPSPAGWVGLAWALPFFAFTGGIWTKFPRYLLPLTPLLAVYGGRAALRLGRRPRRLLLPLALFPAGLLSLALITSYRAPHPWAAASDWMRAHIPPGSVVAVEEWDHPLPLDPSGYTLLTLPVFDPETEEKWARMEEVLSEADIVVIASRRGYGSLARWPERFPQTTAYYTRLLAGERGFEIAACFGRYPRLGPLILADDPFRAAGLLRPACSPPPTLPRLDESLVVYDHPFAIIFRREEP